MMRNEKASISVRKIAFTTLLFIIIFSVGVLATNIKINDVKIILSNKCEINVLTTKTKISDILDENHIIIMPDENVVPDEESHIDETNTIRITKMSDYKNNIIKLAEENSEVSIEQLLCNYSPIVEKIVTEQIAIPYETITKQVTEGQTDTTTRVLQEGKDGIKEITYRAKYKNEEEVERIILSEKVISEPINKIVQVNKKSTSRSNQTHRVDANPAINSTNVLAKRVVSTTPIVKTFNTSAYDSCIKCCGKSNGITSSGVKATPWYTIAAGNAYPVGTIIYIPSLKDKPNEGWFIVQDRGGSISNSKIDIYMTTHAQALQFGRKNLECYVYVP